MNYLDFVLEIGTSPGRFYPVYVISSPAGEAREFMEIPFNEQQLENQLQALQQALIRSNSPHRKIISPEEQTVQKFGLAIFDALFTGEVRNRYDVSQLAASHQGKGLRLKLRIQPPELASLPWEFLYDKRQDTYICLSNNTPIIRYLDLPRPTQPLTVSLPLSILGMIANPKELLELDIEREKQRIEKSLEVLRNNGQVELTWLSGRTCHDLQRAMRSGTWHIFHFIGHGGFNVEEDEGLISLEDDEGYADNLSATQLGRLLADHRFLRLAVLNSCDGARGSKYDVFSSTAAILVQRGIPAVLAMQYEITDTAAIVLSRTFYEVLAEGLPVDTAVAEARKSISIEIRNTLEWGTPVLYMRSPDGVLFDLQLKRYKNSTNVAIKKPTNNAPPIDEQIEQWIQAKAKLSNSRETTITYKTLMRGFRHVLQDHDHDLDSEDVSAITSIFQVWAEKASRKATIKPKTYNQRLSSIRSFYNFALTQEWIEINPLEEVAMREEDTVDAAKPIDREKVRNVLHSIPRNTLKGKRDYAILCILLTTGMRSGEIAGLRCGHVAKTESGVTITTRPKGGGNKDYPLLTYTAQALIDYLTLIYSGECAPDDPVWISGARNRTRGFVIGKAAISDICKKWLGTPKVEATKRTYEAIKKEYGDKELKNIEKLLGIDIEEDESF